MTALAVQTTEETMTEQATQREQLKIVIVGHVDHGKSTLVGRLFHDTDSLPEGKLEQIQAMCEKRGMPFEYSFLTDALQSERDQGITVDTTQIWFKTEQRDYVIIDAPGHKDFLKNMISGAASSEAAILTIDANEGVQEQSKRHGYLLHLLGVEQIAVAVNKMDLVDYSEETFRKVEAEYREYLKGIGVEPTFIIPISAREGDLITGKSENMDWYKGPSILEALDAFQRKPAPTELPLRFPVQDVYKFDERRIIAGRIESGRLRVGDELIFSPLNRVVKVNSIENFNGPQLDEVSAGMSVGITLSEQIFAERGHVISHNDNDAPKLTNVFRAKLFYLGDEPLKVGSRFKMKLNTSEYSVEVKEIEQVVNTDDLSHDEANAKVNKHDVAEVILRVRGVAALDEFSDNAITGRFVLMHKYRIVGGGIVDMQGFADQRVQQDVKSTNLHRVETRINPQRRAIANGHLGGVLWFTGLSGAGKTTLALELQQRLFMKGYQVFVLDGDNIRHGLCADLDFSPEGRTENIRRIGEVAALFADSGNIVITAFIAPYKKDRDRARVAAREQFHSIYIKADVETCKQRDPKGLYEKAERGEIKDFTGVNAPYEEPDNADLIVDTSNQNIDESVEQLIAYIEKHMVQPVRELQQVNSDGGDI